MVFRSLFLIASIGIFAEHEPYVTYATANYFPLLEVLLDSMKAFSSHPIIAFGVNAEIPFSSEKYPFLTKRRIDIELPQNGISFTKTIMLLKPRILLESGIESGVYIDADIILNVDCDHLFSYCKQASQTPLSPTYPHEATVPQELIKAMGVEKPTMRLVHDPVIVFTQACIPFFEQWEKANQQWGNLSEEVADESTYNVLLWQYGATTSLPVCDPFFLLFYDYYYGETRRNTTGGYYQGNKRVILDGYKEVLGNIHFYLFHGCKSANRARSILDLLIQRANDE